MAIAATVMAVSCKKGGDPTPTPEPGPDPTPTYVQPITIDGDFADWADVTTGIAIAGRILEQNKLSLTTAIKGGVFEAKIARK